jgi:prepilin-type N-terminal cleavage/methylation domain-containing protein
MKTPISKTRRGFTLMELMVAMAITALIVTVLVSITSIALDTWNRSRAEVRASRQAKSMADSLARDFEALVTRRGNNFEWLYAKSETTLPGPSSNPSSNASELIFFTGATDRYDGKINTPDDKGGDVSCVAYRLEYQDPIQGVDNDFSTFTLYRKLVNPDETFEDLLGKEDLSQAFSSYSAKLTDVENFVCENVFQYTVTFHVEVTKTVNGKAKKLTVPVILGASNTGIRANEFRINGGGLELQSNGNSQVTADELKAGRVAAMEVSLTVISDFGVDQMRRRTFTSDDARAKFLAQNSFQYSKLVELPGM